MLTMLLRINLTKNKIICLPSETIKDSDDDELQPSLEICEVKDTENVTFKCMNCQVTPFETDEELKTHMDIKHTIKCKFCGEKSENFKSRGYLNVHQREAHPIIWQKIQEKKQLKKSLLTANAATS